MDEPAGRRRNARPHRRTTWLAVLVLLSAFFVLIPGSKQPASASDSRPNDVVGEIAAYYRHFLGRDPDNSGMAHYLNGTATNCQGGLYDAAFSMATSPEAAGFLTSNDRKANSIYAGLLNRVPDAKGWNDQKNALDNGTPWATVVHSVISEPEYSSRVKAICGQPSTAPGPVECNIITQGPPSASIPPDLQAYFQCQSPGTEPEGDYTMCIISDAIGLGGLIKTGSELQDAAELAKGPAARHAAEEALEGLGKIAIKKIGPVGFAVTTADVLVAFHECTA